MTSECGIERKGVKSSLIDVIFIIEGSSYEPKFMKKGMENFDALMRQGFSVGCVRKLADTLAFPQREERGEEHNRQ